MKYPARALIILLAFCFALPALATQRNVQSYGAMGNGSTDDTAAINSAIAALVAGDELYFPCPSVNYKISSALTVITKNNVTVDGQTGCSSGQVTIKGTGGSFLMQVGSGLPSSSTALTAVSAELSTTFSANFAAFGGLAAGDYVLLQEGGRDSSGGSGDTACDVSGCRGEVLQIASVNSNTATVTTALHYRYDPSVNAAKVAKVNNVVTGANVNHLTFDGSGTAGTGLYMLSVANSTVANVNATNTVNEGLLSYYSFDLAWNTVTVTHAGNEGITLVGQGRPSMNGVTISSLSSAAFGIGIHTASDGTYTNVTIDKAGSGTGRPCKTIAVSYSTFNSLTCKNGPTGGYNGLSLEYYSSHNTFNNCVVTNNSGHGITGFGNYNTFNKFVNCTVSGNTGNQLDQDKSALGFYNDANWEISGGTYTGSSTGINMWQANGTNIYVHGVSLIGPGNAGIEIGPTATNGCYNGNTFSGTLTTGYDIDNKGTGNLFNSNTTPDGTTPSLPTGACPAAGGAPDPPTGLTATVN